MTVLIKGREMPKNCSECQFCHTENFETWCCPTEREDIFYDAIPEWCPLTEPKTGEWIDIENDEYYRCSLCGCESGYAFYYCPNCGADMNEARADDDE